MTTVALFGGSFNPPHLAHQLVTLAVLEVAAVDAVWWVPTYRHAFGKELVAFDHRVAMCRLATARFGAAVRVDEIEADIPNSRGRTLETLQALGQRHPGVGFRLVVGSDILAEAHHWYRWDEVVAAAPPLVVSRAGHPTTPYDDDALPEVLDVSSTEVRERLAGGGSAVPLVSRAVMDYIAARSLYR